MFKFKIFMMSKDISFKKINCKRLRNLKETENFNQTIFFVNFDQIIYKISMKFCFKDFHMNEE